MMQKILDRKLRQEGLRQKCCFITLNPGALRFPKMEGMFA